MRWTQQMLAHYLGRVRTVVEFEGITEEGLEAALRQEALRRLEQIEAVIFCEEMTEQEKVTGTKAILQKNT